MGKLKSCFGKLENRRKLKLKREVGRKQFRFKVAKTQKSEIVPTGLVLLRLVHIFLHILFLERNVARIMLKKQK